MREYIRKIIEEVGEDPDREGLLDTVVKIFGGQDILVGDESAGNLGMSRARQDRLHARALKPAVYAVYFEGGTRPRPFIASIARFAEKVHDSITGKFIVPIIEIGKLRRGNLIHFFNNISAPESALPAIRGPSAEPKA